MNLCLCLILKLKKNFPEGFQKTSHYILLASAFMLEKNTDKKNEINMTGLY